MAIHLVHPYQYSPGLWDWGGWSVLSPNMDVTPPAPTGEMPPMPGRNAAWFIHMCRVSWKNGEAAAAWWNACLEYIRGGGCPKGPLWLREGAPPVSPWLLSPRSSWIAKGLRWGSVGAVRAVMWAWAAWRDGETCKPPRSIIMHGLEVINVK